LVDLAAVAVALRGLNLWSSYGRWSTLGDLSSGFQYERRYPPFISRVTLAL